MQEKNSCLKNKDPAHSHTHIHKVRYFFELSPPFGVEPEGDVAGDLDPDDPEAEAGGGGQGWGPEERGG